jgi:arginase family enzyme
LLVHFDVDAIDSTDYPLANFPQFNLGQPFDSAMTCLATFCGSSKLGGLVVTEVNPDHDADGSLLAQLVNGIVAALQQRPGLRLTRLQQSATSNPPAARSGPPPATHIVGT